MHPLHAPADIRPDSPLLHTVGRILRERRGQRRREELAQENLRLKAEHARLADENQALRDAAAIWIRLYESQLARANRAIELLAVNAKAEFCQGAAGEHLTPEELKPSMFLRV
jgi:hypothetical protein